MRARNDFLAETDAETTELLSGCSEDQIDGQLSGTVTSRQKLLFAPHVVVNHLHHEH